MIRCAAIVVRVSRLSLVVPPLSALLPAVVCRMSTLVLYAERPRERLERGSGEAAGNSTDCATTTAEIDYGPPCSPLCIGPELMCASSPLLEKKPGEQGGEEKVREGNEADDAESAASSFGGDFDGMWCNHAHIDGAFD